MKIKKIISHTVATLIILFSFGLSVRAESINNCSVINNANYDACCSGVASNDSIACNNYLNNDKGTATTAQCSNITSYVIYGNCCSGVASNDSNACNVYNTDNNGTPAATLTKGGSVLNVTPSSALGASNTGTSAPNQSLNIHLNNPLHVSTIGDAINLFLGVIIRIALPLIILFFIWSGLTFIFARGNPKKIEEAKNIFFYTIIGTLLILGAWVITNAIIGTVNSIIG